ncbi:DUF881 domain-containing protein [Nocardioides scoriae]|nr:DUF881 domain-containing protein [Nocardioides scoriae]
MAPDPTRRPGPLQPTRLPPQATMGLLDYLTSHAMDEDYAFVAERERAQARDEGHRAPRRRRFGALGAVALAAFAVLVVAAGQQTSRSAASDEADRRELASQVASARTQLAASRERLADLEAETSRLQQSQLAGDASTEGLLARIERLSAATGTAAVRGPGVRVVADDAPGSTEDKTTVLDSDLQRLANGLWEAGAEAISINGQRLTNLSTIRLAGGAITVNARSLRPPYVLNVIGDPDTLPARFAETSSGQAWLDLQQQVGLVLRLTPEESLRLPAAEVDLRFARQAGQPADPERSPARDQTQGGTP